jgi:phage host-nuclease inhibitor protein Gam
MTNRIKLPAMILSRMRAEEILGEIAVLKLEEREQKNALDRQLTAARERYEEPLSTLGKQIEEKTAVLERWAEQNPEEFARGRKSIEMIHGLLGYRTGTPKLKLLRGCSWDSVLLIVKNLAKFAGFVRVKEEVNKEAILAAASASRINDDELKQIGVKVVQEEAFFVEPKLEDQVARETREVLA